MTNATEIVPADAHRLREITRRIAEIKGTAALRYLALTNATERPGDLVAAKLRLGRRSGTSAPDPLCPP